MTTAAILGRASLAIVCFAGLLPGQDELPDPVVLQKQGKIDEAAKAWRARIEREPDNVKHRLALIMMLVDAKRTERAVAVCEAAVDRFEDNYEVNLATAKVHQLEAERISRAGGSSAEVSAHITDSTVFAEDAKRLRPDQREPRAMLALAFLQLGRSEEAKDEIDELVRRFPNHPGGFILRGNLLIFDLRRAARIREDKEELFKIASQAKVAFNEAIRLDPRRMASYRRLGDLAAWQGEIQLALGHYAKALARDPARGAPLAWVYQHLPAEDRLAYFQGVVVAAKKLGTPDGKAWAGVFWYAGLAAFQTQDWKVTRALMQQAFALEPTFTNTHFYIGLSWYNEGKLNEATLALLKLAQTAPKQLADAIAASGNSAEARAGVLSFLARRAHEAGALAVSRDLNHALAIYTKSALDWNNYALLCRDTGRFEESLAGYEQALAIAPKDPAILNDCAVILQYHLHRDLDKARKLYEAAITEGTHVLATKTADPGLLRAARQAIQDARGNLAKLGK